MSKRKKKRERETLSEKGSKRRRKECGKRARYDYAISSGKRL